MKNNEAAIAVIKSFIQTDPAKAAQALAALLAADAALLLKDLPQKRLRPRILRCIEELRR